MNLDGTPAEMSSVPSNPLNFYAGQQNGVVSASMASVVLSNQGEQKQQQQPMSLQPTATQESSFSGTIGSGQTMPMHIVEQQQFPMHQDPRPSPFSMEAVETYPSNPNVNSNAGSGDGNGVYYNRGNSNQNAALMENNKRFFSSVENNNPAHNIGEISQRQRFLSEDSLGSFSMDALQGNDIDSGDNANDVATTTATTQLTPLRESNSVPQQKTPLVVNNNNTKEFHIQVPPEHNHNALKPHQQNEEKISSPPLLTTTPMNNERTQVTKADGDSFSNDNTDQLKRYETSLRALGTTQKTEKIPLTATQATTSTDRQNVGRDALPIKNEQQQQQATNDQVIDLLDDVEPSVQQQQQQTNKPQNAAASGVKRERPPGMIRPGSSLHGYQFNNNAPNNGQYSNAAYKAPTQGSYMMRYQGQSFNPIFFTPPNHTPTWGEPLPTHQQHTRYPTHQSQQRKHFELSLLNLSEFTITGLPVTFDGRPSSCLGFRKIVKQVSLGHGKPVFERDNPKNKNVSSSASSAYNSEQYSSHGENQNPDGGKWRIPLGAYQAFYSYLKSERNSRVEGIPGDQLRIASLGKARLEKGFPSAQKVIVYGVPRGLARALAPFQRGGVDFVVEKNGRALIADDMGLGKTIQSIASMSIYHDEWPLLILTPSSARYHWAAEFNNWLGSESSVNKKNNSIPNNSANHWENLDPCEEEVDTTVEPRKPMRLLRESEIHVMVAGKEKIFPNKETRIVICSYGLATSLVDSGKLRQGLFRCAIVDESHMLKNIKTKRTSKLVPILHATSRCILLSGTPALARPTELWPQLKILSTERDGWWDDENEFIRKYVQRTSAIRRAELHTMLTGTVMIRRLKHNILKSLPKKQREKAVVDILTPETRQEFHKCMRLLREGKGVMAKIAKKHSALTGKSQEKDVDPTEEENKRLQSLKAEYNDKCRQKLQSIRFAMQSMAIDEGEKKNLVATYFNKAKAEIDIWYKERVHGLQDTPTKTEEELDRKTILNKMYTMTAKAKIPFIADLVGKWLDDPTKGKMCIFAHHIYVLDEIVSLVGLSNNEGSRKRFIRIDGSTNPKERQAQIVAFQNDPDIRIAVLGITAAGVAVTLTAASTVWFTELFWTPALMIQAEDRCHRIGQNAAVKCLYFVASGTLDVLLWDLLEKKFRDLGEFVEGKEKMKIVVQHTYKSVKELQSLFIRTGDDDLEDDAKSNEIDTEAEGDDLLKLENDLQEDIVQLAQEEMGMITQGDDEDGADNKGIAKQVGEEQSAQLKPTLGQTEDEAICLSDDEDGDDVAVVNTEIKKDSASSDGGNRFDLSNTRVLRKFRFYRQSFRGPSYGIQLLALGRRLVVAQNQFGNQKPALGDVLVAVNGVRVNTDTPMEMAVKFMKNSLMNRMTELTFLEDEEFLQHFSPYIMKTFEYNDAARILRNKKLKSAPPTNNEGVIELLDDEDE